MLKLSREYGAGIFTGFLLKNPEKNIFDDYRKFLDVVKSKIWNASKRDEKI
jgi:hypothetical protein